MTSRTSAIVALALAAFVAWVPAPGVATEVQAGRTIEITGDQQHQQFAAGETVKITANVADDVFAAGRTVTLDGAKAQTVVAGAGSLVIRNSTIRDLIAGSWEVEIHGTIEDDAVIAVCPICGWASRRILIGKDARIGDDARLFADTIEIEGTIARELYATARRVVVSGTVTGKADIKAKEIVIAPTAKFGGEVTFRSPGKPQIATGATLAGPVKEVVTEVDFPDAAQFPRQMAWFAATVAIAVGLGLLALGVLAQFALPRLIQASADRLAEQPWPNLGYGLVWGLLTPAVAGLLAFTLVGAPAAFVLMAGFVVVAALGYVTTGYAAGLWLRQRFTQRLADPGTWGRIGWTVLGLLILLLVSAVPFVGWIVATLAFTAGLGAAVAVVLERFRGAGVATVG